MENLEIYNKVKEVPKNAQKQINAGRLKGMTDINPQWRIEKLTEVFGPIGIGWYTEETKREFVNGANDEIMCFVDINLYVNYKVPMNLDKDLWSKPIYGTGGSTFVAKESKRLYTSDEVVKMAYTDAISVACKQLGFGADIYWNKNDSKYQQNTKNNSQLQKEKQNVQPEMMSEEQLQAIRILFNKNEELKKKTYEKLKIEHSEELLNKLTKKQATSLIKQLKEKVGD